MKIIDLLNKIADGEEAPKKIKYNGWVLAYDRQPCDYYCEEYGHLFEYLINEKRTIEWLNEEVEIIEEDKKIEKIHINGYEEILDTTLANKINEIIDYINKGE